MNKFSRNGFVVVDGWRTVDPAQRVHFDRFAMPIKRAFAGMVGADIDRFGNVEPYESTKGEVIPWLGVSYRQWQIDFSESFLKGYSQDIFAKLFVQRNSNAKGRAIVVPDSGFAEEVAPVAEHFGRDNILLVRIHRPGFDFTGDSRSYLYNVVPNEVDVHNDSDVFSFHKKLESVVGEFLQGT